MLQQNPAFPGVLCVLAGLFRFLCPLRPLPLNGQIGVDEASTQKVELVGRWREWIDDLTQAGPEVRPAETVVSSLSLKDAARGRSGQDALFLEDHKLLVFDALFARERGRPVPVRHRFGDTRYRRVTYEAVAASVFRDAFPVEYVQEPGRLTRISAPVTLDVLSTARPAAPQVQYVIPTFGWETAAQADGTDVRTRRGGSLRVYLDRPWYSSGEGELLGVVLATSFTTPKAVDYPFVTIMGQDPLWAAPVPAFPQLKHFRGVAAVGRELALAEIDRKLTVVGFAVQYDAEEQRWFADVELDTQSAYRPFVRLALARYQPNSLAGQELSQVVLADIVQTLPDRTLTILRGQDDPGRLILTVTGPAYTAIRDLIGATHNEPEFLSILTAHLERRDARIQDTTIGWSPLGGDPVTLGREDQAGVAVWRGEVVVPDEIRGSTLRLVVMESERFYEVPEAIPHGQRMVYADVFNVPPLV